MVRFCLLADRGEEAERWRDHAATVAVKDPHGIFSRLEIAALFGDDREVLRLADRYGAAADFRGTAVYGPAMVLFGAACARTGDESGARRWWNRAVSFESARAYAEMQLEELDRPGDDRNDPWYFGFLHLMPRRVIQRITADGRSAGSDQEYITELLHEYPQIAGSARYLIRTGDDLGRYFGLLMAEHTHAESLVTDVVQLLTGNVLRKDRKRQAMEILADRDEAIP